MNTIFWTLMVVSLNTPQAAVEIRQLPETPAFQTKAVEAAVRARANDERAQRENAKRSSPKDASVVGEAEAPTPLPDSRSENTGGRDHEGP